jgi:hypothetical protein
VEWGILLAYPELVTYLVKDTGNGPCFRLIWYWKIAKNFLVSGSAVDGLATDNLYSFANDEEWRVSRTAEAIQKLDNELRSMLGTVTLPSDITITNICQLYARLVVGHESDPNCKKIVAKLIHAGVKVPEGTCG